MSVCPSNLCQSSHFIDKQGQKGEAEGEGKPGGTQCNARGTGSRGVRTVGRSARADLKRYFILELSVPPIWIYIPSDAQVSLPSFDIFKSVC